MRKVVLHVGLEKTGTTFLQETFLLNQKQLASQGILYPKSGREGCHHYWLAKAFGFCFEVEKFDRKKAALAIPELELELESTNKDTILISSEHFDFNVTEEACQNFRSYFSAYDVDVVIFLRNQVDYAQSLYIEHIKWGGEKTFREFLDVKNKFDFFEKVNLWRSAGFNVKVVDYDQCRDDILANFWAASGLQINAADLEVGQNEKNVSPAVDFMELVRQLNISTEKDSRRERYLKMYKCLQKGVEGTEAIFPKRKWSYPLGTRPIVEQWQKSNRKLANLLGEEFDVFLGGPLLPKFACLREFEPPNIRNFLLADESSRSQLLRLAS